MLKVDFGSAEPGARRSCQDAHTPMLDVNMLILISCVS